ncbi:unnamed protein product [Symbiodinium sp. KB8]|nr:unnamed protein product [Symbiodinium sp. KB8]
MAQYDETILHIAGRVDHWEVIDFMQTPLGQALVDARTTTAVLFGETLGRDVKKVGGQVSFNLAELEQLAEVEGLPYDEKRPSRWVAGIVEAVEEDPDSPDRFDDILMINTGEVTYSISRYNCMPHLRSTFLENQHVIQPGETVYVKAPIYCNAGDWILVPGDVGHVVTVHSTGEYEIEASWDTSKSRYLATREEACGVDSAIYPSNLLGLTKANVHLVLLAPLRLFICNPVFLYKQMPFWRGVFYGMFIGSLLTTGFLHSAIVTFCSSSLSPNQSGAVSQPKPLSLDDAKQKREQTWVILLAQQRSGTHWLTEKLNQHPCIDIQPEILCCNDTSWWPPALRKMGIRRFLDPADVPSDMVVDGKKMPWQVERYVQISARELGNGKFIRGFNWKINQGFLEDWPVWFHQYSSNHSIRILWVQRKNLVRRLVSGHANQEQHIAATQDDKMAGAIKKQKVTISPKLLLRELKTSESENSRLSKFLESSAVQHRRVYYEDIVKDMDDVWSFMLSGTSCKTPPVQTAARYQKLHDGKIESFLQNFEEIKDALADTQWSQMLED